MIIPLKLGQVHLPAGHPRAGRGPCPLYGYAIDLPDGVIVVDTGCGKGHRVIDELYQPTVVDLVDALNDVGIDERRVEAIVNTHLHFDHCGQNHLLPRSAVWVTQAELDTVAADDHYTVREWATIAPDRLRLASDGERIADGIRLVATPGHTPGHQSVVVTGVDDRPDVIVGQTCYDCTEFSGERGLDPGDVHDPGLESAAATSLLRLRSLRPSSAYFSHDSRIYCSP